jgi:iron complex outermembrane recepter protein
MITRVSFLVSSWAVLGAALSNVGFAQAQMARIDLPVQSLADAVKQLAKETNTNLSYDESIRARMESRQARALKAEMSVDRAFAELLAGSGLTHRFLNEHTVVLMEGERKPVASAVYGRGGAAVRLAQMEPAAIVAVEESPGEHSPGVASTAHSSQSATEEKLDEIVVTAQKRKERLQDVPISISVLGGSDLDKSTVQSLNEALTRVPGVAVSSVFLGGGANLTVRGVTSSLQLFQGASPIAYYLDSVPFGFVKSAIVPDPNVYDLERVEVLRGPQGTLYGASALNGVVRVLTHDADLNAFEFKGRTAASSTKGGGENYRGDLAINVPIIEGKLAARAVGGYQKLSGWIDKPNDTDANDAALANFRLKVNAQPTERLSVGALAWFSRDDVGAPSIGLDQVSSSSLLDEAISNDYDVFGLKIGYEFPTVSLTGNTSYLDYINRSKLDLAAARLRLQTRLPARTFAQEIILNSTHEGPWRWTLGGIYRDTQDKTWQFLPNGSLPDGTPIPGYSAPTDVDNISKSFALFGEVTRRLMNNRVELTAGLRYFEDDVAQREHSRLTGVPADQLVNSDSSFSATTPRLVLTWHSTDRTTFYASYGQGFRSGFDQIPTVLVVAPIPPAEPDKLTNYEVGAKSSLFGGQLQFDSALFYVDWQDVQLPIDIFVTPTIPIQATVNGASASGLGIDLGLMTQPIVGLEFGINASWNDLTVDSDVQSGNFLLFGKGDRLPFSPKYTAGVAADYSFPLHGDRLTGRLSTSANYTSTRNYVVPGLPHIESDAMLIGRASFSIESRDRWVATLFADNVNNEDRTPFRANGIWDAQVRPRTIGLQLEYQY